MNISNLRGKMNKTFNFKKADIEPSININNFNNNNTNYDLKMKLAVLVVDFITMINKFNINIQNKQYEMLKNNLILLTNKIIKRSDNKNTLQDYINDNDNTDVINKLTIKNKDIETLLKIKEEEIKKISNQVILLKKKTEESLSENKIKYNEEIKNIKKENEKEKKKGGDDKLQEILKLNKKIENLNSSIKSLGIEKSKINKDLSLKNNQINLLNTHIANYKIKNETLLKQLKEKEIILQKINSNNKNKKNIFSNLLIDKNNIIKYYIKGTKDLEKEYQNKLDLNEKEKNNLKNELEKIKLKCNEYNISYKNLDKKYTVVDSQKKQLSQKIKDYKIEIEKNKSKLIDEIKESSKENDNYDSDPNKNDSIPFTQYKEILDKNNELNNIINDLKNQLNSKEKNNNEIHNNFISEEANKLLMSYNKEIKEKDLQIEYLNNEIQELKLQMEDNNMSNTSVKDNEYKEIINDYESKIKFFNEHNNYYQKTLNEYQSKLKEYENEIKELKSGNKSDNIKFIELNITNDNFNILTKENPKKNIDYGIPIDKFNKILEKLNDLEEKYNILQKENLSLKANKSNMVSKGNTDN